MPELPEVETVVRDLRPELLNRRLSSVRVSQLALRKSWRPEWEVSMVGKKVKDITRRGKWILMHLSQGGFLVIHLGMTGQLQVFPATEAHSKHTHLVWGLDNGRRQLRFRDVRRFGSACFYGNRDALERFFTTRKLGPEPFDLGKQYWQDCLGKTTRCLKAILLDQRVVAGVGNIYADESLFAAKLPPTRLGKDTRPAEADRLRKAIVTVLNRAISKRGSTIRDYVGGSGLKGQFQVEFRVYGQTGKPCPRCHWPIECIRLAGRSTHFCPVCQSGRVGV